MKSISIVGKSGASTGQPKSSGISRDEWLKALRDADIPTENDPSALTIDEMAEMLGVSKWIAKAKLRALERAGKAVRTIKRKPSPVGRMVEYVAYRLVQ